jgi:hypothetical protein
MRETYSSSWLNPPGIETKYSLSSARSRHPSSSLDSTPSSSCPLSMGLISFCDSLSCNLRLVGISCLHSFRSSYVFLSSSSLGLISFRNTSNCFTTLFTFPRHHFSTMVTLLMKFPLIYIFYYPIYQRNSSPS